MHTESVLTNRVYVCVRAHAHVPIMGVGRVRQALLELMAPRRAAWPDILEPRAERRNATPKPSMRGER